MLLHTSISHQNADNNKQTELVLTQKNEFMKKVKIIMIVVLTSAFSLSIRAQGVSTGLDLVSTYVWRGTKLSGASIQPFLQYNKNGFIHQVRFRLRAHRRADRLLLPGNQLL